MLDIETWFNTLDNTLVSVCNGTRTLGDLYNSAIWIWVSSANNRVGADSFNAVGYIPTCMSGLHVFRNTNHDSTFVAT